ncbi:MAG: hypothetical protein HY517_05005 [Candidatus Aenigmarchaeota archaeon]|nr:hypothetical protein [Candidatus Aenigmarchaeota archaeon]
MTEYEEKVQKLTNVRMLFMTSIVSALALVVGLFWNEAIKAAIEQIVPGGEGLGYKFLAAVIVTIIVVIIIYILIHGQRVTEKSIEELKEELNRKKKEKAEKKKAKEAAKAA